MLTRDVLNIVRDERGGGTVMGLFWFMVIMAFCGMAIDTTNALRNKTGMQATADAAALAASIDLPDEGASELPQLQPVVARPMPAATAVHTGAVERGAAAVAGGTARRVALRFALRFGRTRVGVRHDAIVVCRA